MDFVSEFDSPVRGNLTLNSQDQRCPYRGQAMRWISLRTSLKRRSCRMKSNGIEWDCHSFALQSFQEKFLCLRTHWYKRGLILP
jgi:hypothetical protein